jgi:hypothetical protein
VTRTRARRTTATRTETATPPRAAGADILAWENDPYAQSRPTKPPALAAPIVRPVPNLAAAALGVSIVESRPSPARYNPGSAEFRYWTAAEALRRAADFWAPLLPSGTRWYSTVGARLSVTLDAGEDLNAYYDRNGLDFFHGPAGRMIVYSGESPDVVCHEFGHAVLDALRPQLWNAATAEAAAFHESFGDMSALLTALQLQSMRERVLLDTDNRLYRTSQLSRLAEQLGWAIRQSYPDAVDTDCLRNAVNSFFYKDPTTLPPSAPASLLSSEPHSFSRVFTGAFFEALGGIFATFDANEANLQQASIDAAKILIKAVQAAPVVPSYYSQVAAGMLRAAPDKYNQALSGAFMRHGILSPESAHSMVAAPSIAAAEMTRLSGVPTDLPTVPIDCAEYGLGIDVILMHVPSQPKRFNVAGAAPDVGSLTSPAHDQAAKAFMEDLVRLGRVDLKPGVGARPAEVALQHPGRKKTHRLEKTGNGVVLKRIHFDCGFDCSCAQV